MSNESRSAHWYHPETFQLVDQVASADGKKMVTATLVHAKKYNYLPGVTTILKILAKGKGLDDYVANNIIRACYAVPFTGNIAVEAEFDSYKDLIMARAGEARDQAADRGKVLHAFLERWIEHKEVPDDPAGVCLIDRFKEWMDINGVSEVVSETAVGSIKLGYCGTPDVLCTKKDGTRIIIDLKTTDLAKFKKPYDSWLLQLGAYKNIAIKTKAPYELVQAIADRESGDVRFIPYAEEEDQDMWCRGFSNLYEVWTIISGFDPRKAK